MRHKTLLMLLMMALAACGNEDPTDVGRQPIELRLTATLQEGATETRAPLEQASGYFIKDQTVGVFLSENSELTVAEGRTTYNDDQLITTNVSDNTGGLSFGTDVHYYWPSSGYGLNVSGWYPVTDDGAITANMAMTATPTFAVQSNQSSDLKSSDLMFASAVEARVSGQLSDGVELNFGHKLMQVKVKLTAGSDGFKATDLVGASISIGTTDKSIKSSAKINSLTTGEISVQDTPLGEPLVLTDSYPAADTYVYAIIPPQDLEGLTMTLTLSDAKGGGRLLVGLPSNTYASNSILTYNIEVKLTGLLVTHTISPWGVSGSDTTNSTNVAYVSDPTSLWGLKDLVNSGLSASDYIGYYVDNEGHISASSIDNTVGVVAAASATTVDESVTGSRILVLANEAYDKHWLAEGATVSGSYKYDASNKAYQGFAYSQAMNDSSHPAIQAAWAYTSTGCDTGYGLKEYARLGSQGKWFLPNREQMEDLMGLTEGSYTGSVYYTQYGISDWFHWSSSESDYGGWNYQFGGKVWGTGVANGSVNTRAVFAF